MIKFENYEVVGWKRAIRGLQAKGYRRTKNGRYEAFCSDHCDTIYLGTHDTVSEAENAVLEYRFSDYANGEENESEAYKKCNTAYDFVFNSIGFEK